MKKKKKQSHSDMSCSAVGRKFLVALCFINLLREITISWADLSATDIIRVSYTETLDEVLSPTISICMGYSQFQEDDQPKTIPEFYARSHRVWEAVPYFYTGNHKHMTADSSLSSPLNYPREDGTRFEDAWQQMWYPFPHYRFGMVTNNFCYHYKQDLQIAVQKGTTIVLNYTAILNPYHYVFVHAKDSVIPTERKMFGSNWRILPMPRGNDSRRLQIQGYEVRKTVKRMLNQPGIYPCAEDAADSDTIFDCFDAYMTKRMRCEFPNPYRAGNGSSRPGLRVCDRPEDVDRYFELNAHLNKVSFADLMHDMKCRLPCVREDYELFPIADYDMPCASPAGCSDLLLVYLTFREREVEYVTEKWLYDRSKFFADMGGYMGLYLGASLIAVYDKIIAFAFKAIKHLK